MSFKWRNITIKIIQEKLFNGMSYEVNVDRHEDKIKAPKSNKMFKTKKCKKRFIIQGKTYTPGNSFLLFENS